MAKDMNISLLLDFYGELLTEKQREAVEFYYYDDLSLGEIAANLGISRQGVRDNIKRAETVLFEMEEKLQLAKKFGSVKKELETVRKFVDIINKHNAKIYHSDDINKNIDIILASLEKVNNEI